MLRQSAEYGTVRHMKAERKRFNKKEIELHVGENFASVSRRVVRAWHKAERGEEVHEHDVTWRLCQTVTESKDAFASGTTQLILDISANFAP
jgi:hypothetical protein